MKLEIDRELAALGGLSTGQLCEKYAALFRQPVRTRHKTYLIRKIAWRLHAIAEGDLCERARRRAEELANDADVRVMAPRSATPRPAIVQVKAEAANKRLPSLACDSSCSRGFRPSPAASVACWGLPSATSEAG